MLFSKLSQKKRSMLAFQKRRQLLLEDIKKTRQELETAYANFQIVSDPDLIDCYIYEINSADIRYKYLLNEIKNLNVHNTEPAH